ncbi:MAG TPA: cytochrome b [Burkholderiaceae bacterium]|nr:cytochrome b [Burkholderiaceae bacterium]
MPSRDRYTAPAIALHWLLAVMIVASFCVGVTMADMPFSPTRLKLFNWHKWAGITILALSAARLLWRLAHRPPEPLDMPAWQRQAAHAVHLGLYLLFFAVPLLGWAYSSAAGFPVVVYGVLPLPDFVSPDKVLADAIKPWHGRLAWLLALLVLAHVAAAMKHHFVDRDDVLLRMRPGRS